jgi:general L-amino acid transport system permease protein
MSVQPLPGEAPRVSPLYDPRIRGFVYQAVLVGVLAFLTWAGIANAIANMRARNIPTNFDFWTKTSGFDINFTLINYSAVSTYGDAFLVGLINTLLVAAIGVVFATIIGFIVGIARLSPNWIIAKLALCYVEAIRNVPLLLQLLFWYNAVLTPLPQPRASIVIPGFFGNPFAFLNLRGLFLPKPIFGEGFDLVPLALLLAIVLSIGFGLWARRRQMATGQPEPVALVSIGLIVGLPIIAFFIAGRPATLEYPVLRGFNFAGGQRVLPELVALVLGLTLYTASFIAEIVRAGIQSVAKGQTEAARALGIRPGPLLKLVVIPQAMRVITPPLTNQYLNLTKNSSLAVFIGYPDLVQIFAGTVLNQTGAAVQVIAITMAVYLVISLATSLAMGLYNRRMSLRER